MKIDADAGDVPVDSTLNLRPRSVLGLKYVELTRGKSKETFEDGETMPRRPGRRTRSSSTTSTASSTEKTRDVGPDEPRGLRQRALAAAACRSTRRSRRCRASSTHLDAGRARRSPTTDEPRAASSASSATPRGSSARSPTATRTSSRPAPTRSRRGRASPTACARRSATTRRRWRSASAPSACSGRSCATSRAFSRSLRARDRGHAGRAAADHGRAEDRHPGARRSSRSTTRTSAARSPRSRSSCATTARSTRCAASRGSSTSSTRSSASSGRTSRSATTSTTRWSNVGEHLTEPDPTGGSQRTLLNQPSRTQDPRAPSIGSIGAKTPSNGEPTISGAPMNLHSNVYGAAVNARRQRRLRVRPARLPREAHDLQQRPEPQDRHRPAHPGQPGPDVHRPPARARGPDVHPPPRVRPEVPAGARQVRRAGQQAAQRALRPRRGGDRRGRGLLRLHEDQPVREPVRGQGGVPATSTTSSRSRRCASPA